MKIAQDLRAYLLGKLSNLLGDRLYPDYLPELATFPAVVAQVISQQPQTVLAGGASYAETRVQLDVYSPLASERDTVAEALRNELQGFSGTMGNSTIGSVTCRSARDLFEPPLDNSDTGLFRNSSDWWIRHDQSVPTFA